MSARKNVKKKSTSKTNVQLPTLHPHAGGVDIGATQIQVAVPCDADPKPVRTFTTFTDDLLKQASPTTSAALLGRKGGSATARRHGPEHYRAMAAKRKTHGGGRPRKEAE